ncbi:M1 family aminopeptidase [Flavobacteriaceae bacterium GSB9]|nr:M1 family aminopeptidase [Flavobacteriaceae bacterium GSB9]
MKKIAVLILMFSLLVSCVEEETISLLGPGISLDLANYRKQQVSDVVYALSFDIREAKSEAIDAKLNLSLTIKDLSHPLYLDFNADSALLKGILVNGKPIKIVHEQEHIIVATEHLKIGKNQINILFDAGEQSLNRNDDFLYTLLVPDRASTLFPCFDQPNIKARYVLDVMVPKHWRVLSGGELEAEKEVENTIKYRFKTSDLMSTYLFSFVAGEFEKTSEILDGFNMDFLYRETDAKKIQASLGPIFEYHEKSILFLEDYTQYPFPFQKLDFVAIPGHQYGGMEHVGAVQYEESSLFLDRYATQSQKLNRCRLIAHETAHMWFGDLVTMKWFDDVWLKEVFANFLADKISRPAFPEVNHSLNFIVEHYASAYSEDRTKGATPIKQPLDNLKNAGTLYGNIIYHKSPIMMRQLEALVGESGFKKGMQNYIKQFADGNADWNDLVSLLDAETNLDLKRWSEVWVYQSGRPVITDNVVFKDDKIKSFNIEQHAEDGSENLWPQRFSVGLVYADSVKVVPVSFKRKAQNITTLVGCKKPQSIIYNYDAFGYGVFPMGHLEASAIPDIHDDVARGYSYINLYENVLLGKIKPEVALETLVKGMLVEENELVLSMVSGYCLAIFWKYINPKKRDGLAQIIESKLSQRLLDKSLPSGLKKTTFGCFKSIAYLPSGREMLYGIWDRSLKISNLNLNENDYTCLAVALSIYEHPDAETILHEALNDISNPDRKKRFEFLLPSLSANEQLRDNFMKSLTQAENREKESWVVSALYNIHHPLRQNSAEKHLKMCLGLTEEIQKTGDIFFPKSWLNATIGSYSSPYAYEVVETFLNENPNFPQVLKNKLLQAADGVYKGKKIRNQWQ